MREEAKTFLWSKNEGEREKSNEKEETKLKPHKVFTNRLKICCVM